MSEKLTACRDCRYCGYFLFLTICYARKRDSGGFDRFDPLRGKWIKKKDKHMSCRDVNTCGDCEDYEAKHET